MSLPKGVELVAVGSTAGGNPDLVHRLTSESVSTKALSKPTYLKQRIEMLMAVAEEESRVQNLRFENVIMAARDGWDKPSKEEMYQLVRLIRLQMRAETPGIKLIVRTGPRRAEYLREQGIQNARSHGLHVRNGPSPNSVVFL